MLSDLADGAQKLVDAPADFKPSNIAMKEIMEDKITIDWEKSNLPKPPAVKRK